MELSCTLKNPLDASTRDTTNSMRSAWLDRFQVPSDSNESRAQHNESFAGIHIPREGTTYAFAIPNDNMGVSAQFAELETLRDSYRLSSSHRGSTNPTWSTESSSEKIKIFSDVMLKIHDRMIEFDLVGRETETSILPEMFTFMAEREMLVNRLRELFHNANDEVFEDGMTSRFSHELHDVILKCGVAAIYQLRDIVRANDTSIEVAEEALRQLGQVNDAKTHDARLSLLESSLKSSDLRIRDAASIGIEAMDDSRAIPSLERAVEGETSEWLRQYLKDVITQLKMHDGIPEVR